MGPRRCEHLRVPSEREATFPGGFSLSDGKRGMLSELQDEKLLPLFAVSKDDAAL